MVTFSFIFTRIRLIAALLPLLTFKKVFNLIIAIFFFLVKSARTVKHPPILILALSNKCNYECIMCLKSSNKVSAIIEYENPVEMDYDFLEKFLKEHADYISFVRLHGGEPLYYENIGRLINLLNELKIAYNIITNGSLINEGITDKLVGKYCFNVGLSIDAATKETYETLRKGGNFDTLIANIDRLNSRKREISKMRPVLSASMVVFSKNMHEMSALVDFCADHKIYSLSMSEGWDYKTDEIHEEHLVKSNIAVVKDCIANAYKRAKKRKLVLRTRFPSLQQVNKNGTPHHIGFVKPRNCLNLYASLWLLPDFRVVGCSSSIASLGSIAQTDLNSLWISRDSVYARLRKEFREGTVPAECEKCIYTGSFFS